MTDLDTRRLGVFLAVAFGVSWGTAALLYATGGLTDSPAVVGPLTLAGVLVPTTYMFGPAVGAAAARALGREWDDLWLRPHPRAHRRVYAAVWLGPLLLTVLGAATFFAVFPDTFDPSMRAYAEGLGAAGVEMDPVTLAAVQVVAAVTVAPLINGLFAFGEEFGWRGYLLPKLLPLGGRRAALLSGVVWGVWHWPLIAMGYEYGFGYAGFPWTGLLAFLPFTVALGVLFAWATLREGSVWPATLGHGAVNAAAGVGVFVVRGDPHPLLGPLPVGLLGVAPFVAVAAYLLARSDAFDAAGG
ncbi:CPBP family intramembrane glutamic endopeptidase [Candidatus Halobonum tyrrellensis]|uniref:Abortive infection protein n=1 Tax=Candidatus Halobonum tyrrellensis G22 TaxID=1324957 RepID=V4HIE8_9EURY|nr:CPBP family intramembrane glutamic endopeptidase [Candidatus Halobonum tyrrellensis]ESP89543.1 abortive infection protein [Candidatus Halobonum tyrrellensis G22]